MVALPSSELANVDPLEMNLLVASGIPRLAHLIIADYQQLADEWAGDVRRRLPTVEIEFDKTPHDWKNDIHFFRLGFLCWYIDEVLGIRYREDQRTVTRI